ncbi:antibiotic biosynthesis monooxygenase family protein [Saccharopolyspora phatthalungensis]|uniref:Heme-degrading monooxygenase HmoA n=1 Tax=Saccharopolyspora phatthalungensis TaxID=664693 RepID=A0A840Q2V7_9PSEU|nr:antibiotic biosynthesis monooxygenase [Saccharopolyspora phatthalungensis]MBB5156852.1 heme-degrading monooxygenase HmoA [Saccharopolyspora phatthalungensis]
MLIFVNLFRVHGGAGDFERCFAETSEFMMNKDGYLRHRLVKVNDGEPRYLNIAEWTDEDSLRAAVADPRFESHARALSERASSESLLCEVVQEYEA